MTSKEEINRSMAFAVLAVFKEIANKNTVDANAPLKANIALLEAMLAEFDAQRIIQETSITGFAQRKNELRFGLINSTIGFIGPIRSYAVTANLTELFQSVNYTASKLNRGRDTVLIDRCNVVAGAITANAIPLVAYNITATMLADYIKNTSDYRSYHQVPREMKSAVAAATVKIKSLNKEISELLRNRIDNDMLAYQLTNSAFYNQFKKARKLIKIGVRTAVKGHLADEKTKRKLRGMVIIAETGEIIYGKSSGTFHKTAPDGKYTFIAKVPGYLDKVTPDVILQKGKVLNLDIQLQKAA